MKQPDMPSKELLKILDKTHRTWQMGNFSVHLFNKANLINGSNLLNYFSWENAWIFISTRNGLCKYLLKYGKRIWINHRDLSGSVA